MKLLDQSFHSIPRVMREREPLSICGEIDTRSSYGKSVGDPPRTPFIIGLTVPRRMGSLLPEGGMVPSLHMHSGIYYDMGTIVHTFALGWDQGPVESPIFFAAFYSYQPLLLRTLHSKSPAQETPHLRFLWGSGLGSIVYRWGTVTDWVSLENVGHLLWGKTGPGASSSL